MATRGPAVNTGEHPIRPEYQRYSTVKSVKTFDPHGIVIDYMSSVKSIIMSNARKNHHRKVKHRTKESGYISGNNKHEPVDTSLHLGDSTLQTPEEHRKDEQTDQTKTDKTEVNF